MKTSIKIFTILFVVLHTSLYCQPSIDTLLRKVVIFKAPAYSFPNVFFPQATGFFLKLIDPPGYFLVTVKHILINAKSSDLVYVRYEGITNDGVSETNIVITPGFKNSGFTSFHSDTLIDLLCLNPEFLSRNMEQNCFFPAEGIIEKKDFESIKNGQDIFYIGMFPDSISSRQNYYWIVSGTVDTIFSEPVIYEDKRYACKFTVDFLLSAHIKPGVSGSPVFIKEGNTYKLFGVINAMTNDTTVHGTAAYKIKEIIKK